MTLRVLLSTSLLTPTLLACCLILGNCAGPALTAEEKTTAPPNVIYILADDLGYGDIGVYGQTKFATPNIDRLAARGMLFTDHYSGSTVCAPSRSALLTGQHTGHTPVRGNKEVMPEGQWPMPAGEVTIPEVLKEAGYATGAFGKWGLGAPRTEGDPNSQGFDEFYGYNCQRFSHHYYPDYLWNNQDTVWLPGNAAQGKETYAPDLIHDRALSFIEGNRDGTFFLYYAHIVPHAEMFAPREYLDRFRGKFDPEFAFSGTDEQETPGTFKNWGYKRGAYGSQPEGHAAFAAMVTYLDDHVGEVIDKLDELGIADNTLVIFTSDNGPHQEGGADPDYFNSNGPLRGYKRDLYEGGIRVPMIASWVGRIQPGSRSDHVSAFWDIMPTVAELAGLPNNNSESDGISLAPTLTGETEQEQHDFLYWEFHERGGRQAIRKNHWKLIRYNVNKQPYGEYELYNLAEDIGESNDVATQHPQVVAELAALLESARTDSEVFRFAQRNGD